MDVGCETGRQVGTGIPKVPVIIDFKATKPLSLNVRLEFADPEGRKFSLPLVACADNCLLTISRFLTQYSDRYMLYRRDDGPVNLYYASVVKVGSSHSSELEASRTMGLISCNPISVVTGDAGSGDQVAGEGEAEAG
jgi:hypothetical protein